VRLNMAFLFLFHIKFSVVEWVSWRRHVKNEQVKNVIPTFIILEPIIFINGFFSLKGKEREGYSLPA